MGKFTELSTNKINLMVNGIKSMLLPSYFQTIDREALLISTGKKKNLSALKP
jgi:hypothetical protein